MYLPVGPLVNAAAIIGGTIVGLLLGSILPERIRANLPALFGLLCIGLGIMTIPGVKYFAAVAIALVLGLVIGEWIDIEKRIKVLAVGSQHIVDKILPKKGDMNAEKFLENYVSLVILFCFSGMGIFGAMTEGMSGDPSILYIKAILDVFTAMIFAISLGGIVAFISVPQILFQCLLFFLAALIVPLTTSDMRADFSAAGGLMLLMTGLRIMGIKSFPVANMLPSLILVMPLSYIWSVYVI
ncbi:DUF554 domain-containing protein [Neisseria sp. CCUG12390]|uniref:DUF554 domain-containing protein n=1 Tax=Neisseria sp. CCUG12390 TaxID=3392035 RepID=UPI003A101A64